MISLLFGLFLLAAGPASGEQPSIAGAKAAYASFDHRAAVELLLPLARGGNAEAQRMLGFMYSNGQGVARDEREAAHWYCASVRVDPWDDSPCPWFVYLVREVPGIVWQSMRPMGAERWRKYLEAAEAGDAESQIVLGLLFATGLETRRDLVEAYMWFALAAEQRHPNAGRFIESLELEMTPQQIAEARERMRLRSPTEGD